MSGTAFLVDANVWLDLYLPNRTNQVESTEFFHAAHERNARLLVSDSTLKDVYRILDAAIQGMVLMSKPVDARISEMEAHTARQMAYAYIENLLEIADVLGTDESDVQIARNLMRLHPDFGDNLLIAAGQRANVTCLVSNNARLVADSPIAAVTARNATLLLDMNAR